MDAGPGADKHADYQTDNGGEKGYQCRCTRAVQHAAEHVAAQVIGAKNMLGARALKRFHDILVEEVVGGDMGTNERERKEKPDHEQTGDRKPVLAEAPRGILP